MSRKNDHIFPRRISRSQARDTGMAMVLICLLLSHFLESDVYIKIAIAALVVNMVFPMFYRYIAVVWLGLSHLIGMVVSRILLTLVFFLIVTPVGLARRLFGIDSLRIRKFKKGGGSVMHQRDIVFTREDLEKPF